MEVLAKFLNGFTNTVQLLVEVVITKLGARPGVTHLVFK